MPLAAKIGKTPIATIRITCNQKETDCIICDNAPPISADGILSLAMKVKGNMSKEIMQRVVRGNVQFFTQINIAMWCIKTSEKLCTYE